MGVAYKFCGSRANLFRDIHQYRNIKYLFKCYNKVSGPYYVYHIYFFLRPN